MAYGSYISSARNTASDKILNSNAFASKNNPKYTG